MKTVWKWELSPFGQGLCELSMPVGANILTVQMQDGVPVIWALVRPEMPVYTRYFALVWTGVEVEYVARAYVGTVQCQNGLVYHVFEVAGDVTDT